MDSRFLIYVMSFLSVIYALMAHFTAHSGTREAKRVLATLTLVSLSIWALCYAASFSSTNAEESLFWRKLGVLGWGTVYSFLLHFILLITRTLPQKQKTPLLAMLYLPSILSMVFFLLWPAFANQQYHMVFQNGIWVNQWVDTLFNWLYIAYGLFSILLSMGLLVTWYIRAKNAAEKNQAIAIFLSLLAVIVISLGANQLLQALYETQVIAILIVMTALFPALTVAYHVKRNSLLFAAEEQPEQLQPQILSAKVRTQVYRVAGMALFLFSFLVFFSVTVKPNINMPLEGRIGVISASALFMVFSQALCSLRNTKLRIKQQELMFFIIFIIFDVLLFLRYMNSGGVTVWASILLLIIASTIFDSIWMVMLGTGIHILLMVYTAVLHPLLMSEVSMVDHGWRILIVGAAMGLAYAVNRIYRSRLTDNIEFAKLQASISQAALLMSRGKQENYQQIIQEVMDVANGFLAPDFLLLMTNLQGINPDKTEHSVMEYLSVPNGLLSTSILNHMLTEDSGIVFDEEVCILTPSLPAYAQELQNTLDSKSVDKLLFTPLKTKYGSISLVLAIHKQDRISDQHWRNHMYVSMLANFLTNFIQRIGTERELEQLAYIDKLTYLYKRDRFLHLAEIENQHHVQGNQVTGLLFIDLNGFKEINDLAGHQAGDLALEMVAGLLRNTCSKEDLIGRFGGDEFLVFARRKSEAEFSALQQQINKALTFDYQYDGLVYPLSAAVGSALDTGQEESIWQLLEKADRDMYLQKSASRINNSAP